MTSQHPVCWGMLNAFLLFIKERKKICFSNHFLRVFKRTVYLAGKLFFFFSFRTSSLDTFQCVLKPLTIPQTNILRYLQATLLLLIWKKRLIIWCLKIQRVFLKIVRFKKKSLKGHNHRCEIWCKSLWCNPKTLIKYHARPLEANNILSSS